MLKLNIIHNVLIRNFDWIDLMKFFVGIASKSKNNFQLGIFGAHERTGRRLFDYGDSVWADELLHVNECQNELVNCIRHTS